MRSAFGRSVKAKGNDAMESQRLQKIIAEAGIASRREAERLIEAGRVKVNGEVAYIGMKANLDWDLIEVDGKSIEGREDLVYIMLNKPRGYVTTMKDERGRKTVAELVADCGARVYPVGRLDMNSEGLLIMTNDGQAANRMAHPSGNVLKTYHVKVEGEGIDEKIPLLECPMTVDGVRYAGAKVKVLEHSEGRAKLAMTISEGKNHEIRNMCAAVELEVLRLKRVTEGKLELGGLKYGQWRYLTSQEITYVKSLGTKNEK